MLPIIEKEPLLILKLYHLIPNGTVLKGPRAQLEMELSGVVLSGSHASVKWYHGQSNNM